MSSRLTVAGAARVVPAKSKANIAHIERMSESHPLHGMGLAYTHQQSHHLQSETEADNSSKDVNKASGGLARVNAWAIASFRLATRQLRHYACRRDGPRECLPVMKSTTSFGTSRLGAVLVRRRVDADGPSGRVRRDTPLLLRHPSDGSARGGF